MRTCKKQIFPAHAGVNPHKGFDQPGHPDFPRIRGGEPNNGRVYYVLPSNLDGLGFGCLFCHTDELTYLDTEGDHDV